LIFNTLEEPVAVYEYTPDQLRILRVNASFSSFFDTDFCIDKRSGIVEQPSIDDEGATLILETFQKVANNKATASCNYCIETTDKQQRRIRMALHFWGMNGITSIIFAQFFLEQ
jgi:hypothetical protein